MHTYPYKFVLKADENVVKYGSCHTFGGVNPDAEFGFLLDDNEEVTVTKDNNGNLVTENYNIEYIGNRAVKDQVVNDLNPATPAVDPLAE